MAQTVYIPHCTMALASSTTPPLGMHVNNHLLVAVPCFSAPLCRRLCCSVLVPSSPISDTHNNEQFLLPWCRAYTHGDNRDINTPASSGGVTEGTPHPGAMYISTGLHRSFPAQRRVSMPGN